MYCSRYLCFSNFRNFISIPSLSKKTWKGNNFSKKPMVFLIQPILIAWIKFHFRFFYCVDLIIIEIIIRAIIIIIMIITIILIIIIIIIIITSVKYRHIFVKPYISNKNWLVYSTIHFRRCQGSNHKNKW